MPVEQDTFALIDYECVRLLNIEAQAPADWDTSGATHVRVSLPAGQACQLEMGARGYFFCDRTLDVEIVPARSKINYDKLIRLKPEAGCSDCQTILDIALASFPYDRRFHISIDYNQPLADIIIKKWVENLDEVLVCRLKEEIAGFLAFKKINDKKISIHLAAVLEKYRSAGVALSLYAGAVQKALEHGFEVISGRISSLNTPVMNLYSFLGASFSCPRDIYLKMGG